MKGLDDGLPCTTGIDVFVVDNNNNNNNTKRQQDKMGNNNETPRPLEDKKHIGY